jgi:hypothetical protein
MFARVVAEHWGEEHVGYRKGIRLHNLTGSFDLFDGLVDVLAHTY